jgi:hypothetical protein
MIDGGIPPGLSFTAHGNAGRALERHYIGHLIQKPVFFVTGHNYTPSWFGYYNATGGQGRKADDSNTTMAANLPALRRQ